MGNNNAKIENARRRLDDASAAVAVAVAAEWEAQSADAVARGDAITHEDMARASENALAAPDEAAFRDRVRQYGELAVAFVGQGHTRGTVHGALENLGKRALRSGRRIQSDGRKRYLSADETLAVIHGEVERARRVPNDDTL